MVYYYIKQENDNRYSKYTMNRIVQLNGYQLFYCRDCSRYLNPKYFDKKCSEAHTTPDLDSCALKCKCGGLHKNCRKCNPFVCECGRLIARNKYTIAQHLLTAYHKRHTTIHSEVSQNI